MILALSILRKEKSFSLPTSSMLRMILYITIVVLINHLILYTAIMSSFSHSFPRLKSPKRFSLFYKKGIRFPAPGCFFHSIISFFPQIWWQTIQSFPDVDVHLNKSFITSVLLLLYSSFTFHLFPQWFLEWNLPFLMLPTSMSVSSLNYPL